jgi:xanthine dehydrogenase molybdenum-binding subunit
VLEADSQFGHYDIGCQASRGIYVCGECARLCARKAMMAMGKKISRLYKIPAMRFEGRVVRTSTTPAGACRGYGSPQSHTVTEIHTDLLCRRLGMDPAGFRMKNLVDPFMDDPTGASNIGNARIKDCLTRGLAAFDWDNRKAPSASGRFRRGAGFACCTHGNGYQGTIYHDMSQMSLRILEDGSIILRSGIHELGHAAIATIAQIVAEETGVPPERIAVLEADSQFGHYDIGCQASRGIYVCGECARLCARKAVELLCEQAEILWNLPAGSVVLDKSGEPALLTGDRAIAIGEAVSAIEMKNRVPIDVIFLHRPESNPGSYGAHFADVTVDTLTGLVRVNKYLAVHDVGRVLNRSFIKGQIYGGVQMGLGMALTEELSFDKNGAPSARNFDKYHLVNAPDMPDVEVLLIEDVEKGGPFGAKSIGEIAAVPVAPAVVNAVNRALSTELTDLPLTPSKIVRALKETGVS